MKVALQQIGKQTYAAAQVMPMNATVKLLPQIIKIKSESDIMSY